MLMKSSPCVVACFLFATFGRAAGCSPGVAWLWDLNWFVQSTAYFDSANYAGSHAPWFRGSFIPSVIGSTYAYTPEVEFTFDGIQYPPGAPMIMVSLNLNRDYRYAFSGQVTDAYTYVKVRLEVSWPGTPEHILNTDSAEVCEISGCRDLALTRATGCQPIPPSLEFTRVWRRTGRKVIRGSLFGFAWMMLVRD
jgi:hypothetical protein